MPLPLAQVLCLYPCSRRGTEECSNHASTLAQEEANQLLRYLRWSSVYSRQERVTGRNRVINSEAAERGESDANSGASPATLLAMLRRS